VRRTGPHLPLAIVGAACLVVLLAVVQVHSPLRVVLVLVFLLVAPGLAYVPLLGLRDPVLELVLAVGVSIAFETLLVTGQVYAGLWSPTGSLVLVAVLAACGAAAQLLGPTPAVAREGERG
jgi:hypothetical protein